MNSFKRVYLVMFDVRFALVFASEISGLGGWKRDSSMYGMYDNKYM